MRTTVTLDADTSALVHQLMQERRIGFKQALNDAIRAGAQAPATAAPFRTRTADLGAPAVNLDRALQLAGELEDDELVRRMQMGK